VIKRRDCHQMVTKRCGCIEMVIKVWLPSDGDQGVTAFIW